MSITACSLNLLTIKYLPFASGKTHTQSQPQLSVNAFQSFSTATSMGIKHNRRCSLRPKAGGSQGGPGIEGLQPQDTSQTKPEDSPTVVNTSNNASNQGSSSVLSFLCPLLKVFAGQDPSLPRNAVFEVVTSGMASISRLPWGSKALLDVATMREEKGQPERLLQLYEFEACPFCRRVREAFTELDLSAEIYTCPKGSVRHRELVRRAGGKEQFPYLVDPNTGVSLYESGDIVKYLFQKYGGGKDPSLGLLESTLFTGWVPTIVRAGRGMTLWERANPELAVKRLELFSYENNQNARLVREALCELELPYILHNVGKGSSKTKILLELTGSEKVPYLIDPNTGVNLSNHNEIISYLFQTYCKT
uniref:TSA: Wollemia nobilis Ref_Wollemi_Transcript_26295_1278 transcribed RNA sequence n=1 Tax=Wollemia nobilis TaxID=56998 RepID=A0A0C9RQ24_9CONI